MRVYPTHDIVTITRFPEVARFQPFHHTCTMENFSRIEMLDRFTALENQQTMTIPLVRENKMWTISHNAQ